MRGTSRSQNCPTRPRKRPRNGFSSRPRRQQDVVHLDSTRMVHQGDQVFSVASFRWPGGAFSTAQSHAGCSGPTVPTSAGQPDNALGFSDLHQQPLPERASATSNPTASDYDQAAKRTAIPGVHHLLSQAHECSNWEGVSCIAGQIGVRRSRVELPQEPQRCPGEP